MGRELSRAIIDGILVGGVYALMAVGLTLIFGVLDIINIAQGILVVLAAYLSYLLSVHLHLDLFVGLLVTTPAMFGIGVVIQVLFMRRLRGHERTSMSLLASYAVMIIIEGILYLSFGPDYVTLNAWYVNQSLHILGFYLPYIYLFGFALAVIIVAALYLLLYRTRFGQSLRATMQDRTAARLIGIDINRVAALAFGIGVGVTAVGGVVFGSTNAFNANSGYDLISRLLAIIILGGMGSIGGALGVRDHDAPSSRWWTSGRRPGRWRCSTWHSCSCSPSGRRACSGSVRRGRNDLHPAGPGARAWPWPRPARSWRRSCCWRGFLPAGHHERDGDSDRRGHALCTLPPRSPGTCSPASPGISRWGTRCSSVPAPIRSASPPRTGM